MNARVPTGIVVAAIVITVGIVLWVFSGALYAPEEEILVPPATAVFVPEESKPLRLLIPSLAIDAHVQEVGITTKGTMGVPNNFKDVGWYKYGVAPGQLGSAVIDGHVDNALALAGVFKRLADIKTGDDIYVVSEDGTKLRFIVVDIQSYPYNDAPTDIIFTRDDAARLNLITCAGTWLIGQRTYNKRLVVYTEFANIVKEPGT